MEQVESDTSENLGWPRFDAFNKLNVTIVKSYFNCNKFREYFIQKHLENTLIAELRKANLF